MRIPAEADQARKRAAARYIRFRTGGFRWALSTSLVTLLCLGLVHHFGGLTYSSLVVYFAAPLLVFVAVWAPYAYILRVYERFGPQTPRPVIMVEFDTDGVVVDVEGDGVGPRLLTE